MERPRIGRALKTVFSSMVAVNLIVLIFFVLETVLADVQQPPIPPTATRPTTDKFMKREHSLIKPFQGIRVNQFKVELHLCF